MADYVRGQRLVELRKGKRLSQRDAAYEIGVTEKSLRAWEKGGTIRWHNAQKVAGFYNVDPEELVTREAALNGDDPAGPVTQLDRIEEKLDRVLNEIAATRAGRAVRSAQERSTPGSRRKQPAKAKKRAAS